MTICAPSTASGGAISIIRVSGPQAITITDSLFHGRRSLLDAPGYSLHYGDILTPPSDTNVTNPLPGGGVRGGVILDSVLVTLFRSPHSYTGEDSVEISCHASTYIVSTILQLLCQAGCRMARPGEFTQRAFMNGKMDLSQAEAVADLINSTNAASHRVAMSQMRGGISSKLASLRSQLLHITSLLELELDFSDHEELEFADRTQLLSLSSQLSAEISRLSATFQQGNAIKNGIPVAIIGAPNVGKSTLLNQLLQDDKAIVSDIAGTTRDTIEDTVYISSPTSSADESGNSVSPSGVGGAVGGALFRFIDTAGIRNTDDTIENLGIERSIKAAQKAHVIILMRDPDNDYPEFTPGEGQTVIYVNNKSDDFQAINGKGLDDLKKQLLLSSPQAGCEGTVITNLRHKQALDLANDDINRVLSAMQQGLPADLISEDLRLCLSHLAEITGGAITPDEVLGNIFQHFCIGK